MMNRSSVALIGTWERPGRSLLIAAFLLVLTAGSLYNLGGLLGMLVAIPVAGGTSSWWALEGTFLEFIEAFYARLQLPILAVTAAAQYGFFLALPVLLIRRWHTPRVREYLGCRAPRVLDLILVSIGAVAIVPLAGFLASWSSYLFPVLRELNRTGSSLLRAASAWQMGAVVFAIAVTPAICEEVLFRGYFLGTLGRRLRPAAAVGLSAALFALFHRSPLGLFALAAVGAYLGFVYASTASLFCSMACHFLYNLTVIVLANSPRASFAMEEGPLGARVLIIAVSIAVLAAIVVAMRARGAPRPVAAAGGSHG